MTARRKLVLCLILLPTLGGVAYYAVRHVPWSPFHQDGAESVDSMIPGGRRIGDAVDEFNGVRVFYNGSVGHSGERNLAPDGYNLGIRYQCVEFVKRYYYERFGHRMPDSYGHAREFFDAGVPDGALSPKRALVQFANGGAHTPKPEDLLVFGPSAFNPYGHVAIISRVEPDRIEIVQQNPGPLGDSRATLPLTSANGTWRIGGGRILGWLRLPGLSALAPCDEFFPMMPGTLWEYEGKVARSDSKGPVPPVAVSWKMEAVSRHKVGAFEAAVMRGHPSDLAGLEPGGAKRSDWLAVRTPRGRYHRIEPFDARKDAPLLSSPKKLADRCTEENRFAFSGMRKDAVWGADAEVAPRTDGFYRWNVAEETRDSAAGGAPVTVYTTAYRTNPDHTVAEFAPGIGLLRWQYAHHGTVAECDLRLVRFTAGTPDERTLNGQPAGRERGHPARFDRASRPELPCASDKMSAESGRDAHAPVLWAAQSTAALQPGATQSAKASTTNTPTASQRNPTSATSTKPGLSTPSTVSTPSIPSTLSTAPAATPRVIHLFVALCDNASQGIVPVPAAIGDGDRPDANLYWGCGDGVKSVFGRSPEWKLLQAAPVPGGVILERRVYRHTAKPDVWLVADAYRGREIKQAVRAFLEAAAGRPADSATLALKDGTALPLAAGAALAAYIGHNGLMDFELPPEAAAAPPSAKPAIVLCCKSREFFAARLKRSGAAPLLGTTQFMYPGAFILRDALNVWLAGKTPEAVRTAAAKAYAANQRISVKAAEGVFCVP